LYIPILIFGTSAVNNYNANLGYDTELILLTLILLIFLIISPYLCLKSLKISLD
jgi:ABC-type transport system involved in cytochrome c biogenesis permease component